MKDEVEEIVEEEAVLSESPAPTTMTEEEEKKEKDSHHGQAYSPQWLQLRSLCKRGDSGAMELYCPFCPLDRRAEVSRYNLLQHMSMTHFYRKIALKRDVVCSVGRREQSCRLCPKEYPKHECLIRHYGIGHEDAVRMALDMLVAVKRGSSSRSVDTDGAKLPPEVGGRDPGMDVASQEEEEEESNVEEDADEEMWGPPDEEGEKEEEGEHIKEISKGEKGGKRNAESHMDGTMYSSKWQQLKSLCTRRGAGFLCPFCPQGRKAEVSRANLLQHLSTKHFYRKIAQKRDVLDGRFRWVGAQGGPPQKCQLCAKELPHKFSLVRHYGSVHEDALEMALEALGATSIGEGTGPPKLVMNGGESPAEEPEYMPVLQAKDATSEEEKEEEEEEHADPLQGIRVVSTVGADGCGEDEEEEEEDQGTSARDADGDEEEEGDGEEDALEVHARDDQEEEGDKEGDSDEKEGEEAAAAQEEGTEVQQQEAEEMPIEREEKEDDQVSLEISKAVAQDHCYFSGGKENPKEPGKDSEEEGIQPGQFSTVVEEEEANGGVGGEETVAAGDGGVEEQEMVEFVLEGSGESLMMATRVEGGEENAGMDF